MLMSVKEAWEHPKAHDIDQKLERLHHRLERCAFSKMPAILVEIKTLEAKHREVVAELTGMSLTEYKDWRVEAVTNGRLKTA